jgi:hypothetical protein
MSGPLGSSQWMYQAGEDYTIDQSLRFEDGNSAYLHWTPPSASNRRTWTFSCWLKRGNLTRSNIFNQQVNNANIMSLEIIDGDAIQFKEWTGNYDLNFVTNMKLRDPTAWYHIFVAVDTTQGTDTNRVKLYVNGERVTSFSTETYPSQNYDGLINTAAIHAIGTRFDGDGGSTVYKPLDGYLSEVHFIDGTALTPSSFGETDSTYGHWKPKEYDTDDGAYGTNGFFLPFKHDYEVDGFSTVTYKGNGASQYVGGVGFQPDLMWHKSRSSAQNHRLMDSIRGGAETLKPDLQNAEIATSVSFAADGWNFTGNTDAANDNTQRYVAWCWDMGGDSTGLPDVFTANGSVAHSTSQQKFGASSIEVGSGDYLTTPDNPVFDFQGDFTVECWVRRDGDQPDNSGIISKYEVAGWILESVSTSHPNKIQWRDQSTGATDMRSTTTLSNGTWYHVAVSRRNDVFRLFINGTMEDSVSTDYNYSVSGMNTALYVGRYSAANSGAWNGFIDEIRISDKARYTSNFTAPTAAFSNDANTLLLIHSDTSNGSTTFVDSSGATKNTSGATASYVAANPTYGQSVVSWTGTGSDTTIGHGLSGAPECIFVKNRDNGSTDWAVMHNSSYGGGEGYKAIIKLNSDAPYSTSNNSDYWNNTAPTSSVFTVGTHDITNKSGDAFIAYCWDSVAGYSKFGHYFGNGQSTGNTTTLGFRPAWLLVKRTNVTQDWVIYDTTRQAGTNTLTNYLEANKNGAEDTDGGEGTFTITDTGFTPASSDLSINGNGQTMMYMAFADNREFAYWLDQSGNNNDWSSYNITESDIMVDSPTNNFCTMNPIGVETSMALTNGNLRVTNVSGGASGWLEGSASTFVLPTTGKWYWEWQLADCASEVSQGSVIATASNSLGTGTAGVLDLKTNNGSAGTIGLDGTDNVQTGLAVAKEGDIFAIAVDCVNETFQSYLNGATFGTQVDYSAVSSDKKKLLVFRPMVTSSGHNVDFIVNFGQDSSFAGTKTSQGNQDSNDIGDFYYTPPTNFLALCTENMAEPGVTPGEHFNTVLYTGDGNSTHAITGVGFQPDFVWIKNRDTTNWYTLQDVIRTPDATIYCNTNEGQNATRAYVNSFDSDGFTTGNAAGASKGPSNNSGDAYVSWNWKAGGSGSANTSGTINSTVSANTDAGFSVVSFTGTGSAGTVGHGLSTTPRLIMFKNLATSDDWMVFTYRLTSLNEMNLNENHASTVTNVFNDTNPTSTVFSVGAENATNKSGDAIIAYCFHDVDGFSKFDSYEGNNLDNGTYVYTGFRPMLVVVKNIDSTGEWRLQDTKRTLYNYDDIEVLTWNNPIAEYSTDRDDLDLDFLANGFKHRSNYSQANAVSSYDYIAFAETPFKYSNAR